MVIVFLPPNLSNPADPWKLHCVYVTYTDNLTFNSVSSSEMKIDEFANSVDLDEVAHNEPPHLYLHCLHSSLCILSKIQLRLNIF